MRSAQRGEGRRAEAQRPDPVPGTLGEVRCLKLELDTERSQAEQKRETAARQLAQAEQEGQTAVQQQKSAHEEEMKRLQEKCEKERTQHQQELGKALERLEREREYFK